MRYLLHRGATAPLPAGRHLHRRSGPGRQPVRDPGDLYAILTAAGHQLTWTETVRAGAPTGDDTTTLRVRPDSAILLTRRITTDQTDRALALEETRHSADDTQLAYTLTPISAVAAV